ncbi:CTP synthase [Dehalococcoidia bacterium]|nr:CTP synthase [Dehalococcoidia bacterium]
MTKYIFVTGGVVSSVGKGITAAAIGRLFKSRDVPLSVIKLDPYLNVDPGTMSPYQHGEVFVTVDGAETDLDLGHYERFIDADLNQSSNVTAGQIFSNIISQERRGDFLGGTIQVVPHVTNAIKSRVREAAEESGAEVLVVEVGGTVGDIEGQPFLEAIRQLRHEVGRDDALFIHVTYLPYISPTQELKTKPTQHSVKELRGLGIQPDIIICRSDYDVPEEVKEKISLFCDVERRAVIHLPTVETIYEVPLLLEESGLGEYVAERLALSGPATDLSSWSNLVDRIKAPKPKLSIALVGKYVALHDAYLSVREALYHAGLSHDLDIDLQWINAEDMEQPGWEDILKTVHGIVVPGGFGSRGIEGMIRAAQYARENKIPYLGLCLGMQVMVIEFARNILGLSDANSTEFSDNTDHPVITIMSDQEGVEDKGGTMRLGNYPCQIVPGTMTARTYSVEEVEERHRHRFEFNNNYREMMEKAGLLCAGLSPDGRLVEITELEDHPFMAGSQFHAEFRSRPNRPHPLIQGFIGAAKEILREGDQAQFPLIKSPERTMSLEV